MKTQTFPLKRRLLSWIGRFFLVVLFLIVLFASTSILAGAKNKADFAKNYPPLGQMVDVGGYRLHIHCQGERQDGDPAVIVEAGAGSVGLMWTLVQTEVARTAQICVYDRAGMGWSDPSPQPRSAAVIVEELHTLLSKAKIEAPYLLVGHSLGGIFVREYQSKYPDEVTGLILVDAGDGHLETYMADTVYLQTMYQFINLSQTLSKTGLIKVVAGASVLFSGTAMAYEELGAAHSEALQAMAVKTTEAGTVEVAALPVIWEENRANSTSLGNLPLVVIVHGYCNSCSQDPLELEKEEQGWMVMQQSLASLSSQSKLIQADPETGHDVQIDQPQLIVDAILELLSQPYRTVRKLKP